MEKDVDDYMRETFQIHNKKGSDPVSILDILDTMIAPNVDASVAANGVRQNALACQEEEVTQKSTSLGMRFGWPVCHRPATRCDASRVASTLLAS